MNSQYNTYGINYGNGGYGGTVPSYMYPYPSGYNYYSNPSYYGTPYGMYPTSYGLYSWQNGYSPNGYNMPQYPDIPYYNRPAGGGSVGPPAPYRPSYGPTDFNNVMNGILRRFGPTDVIDYYNQYNYGSYSGGNPSYPYSYYNGYVGVSSYSPPTLPPVDTTPQPVVPIPPAVLPPPPVGVPPTPPPELVFQINEPPIYYPPEAIPIPAPVPPTDIYINEAPIYYPPDVILPPEPGIVVIPTPPPDPTLPPPDPTLPLPGWNTFYPAPIIWPPPDPLITQPPVIDYPPNEITLPFLLGITGAVVPLGDPAFWGVTN